MSEKKIKYSGHQTFTFRYGWLEKGYNFVKEGKSFSDASALVDLGVGKNMVDSIRYWSELAGVVGPKGVTQFGTQLLDSEKGWDPYLEDIASLWLLHWNIATNKSFFTSATVLFSHLNKPEFFKWDVFDAAHRQFIQLQVKKAPSDGMIHRDIDCYIKAYATGRHLEQGQGNDASFACPLQELQLLSSMNGDEGFRLSIGPKASLPHQVIGYAIGDYLLNSGKTSTTVQNMLYGSDAPGAVFLLDENSLLDAVQALEEDAVWGKYFGLIESAGNAQIFCKLELAHLGELLEDYYRPVC